MIDAYEYDTNEEKDVNVLHTIYTVIDDDNIQIKYERPRNVIVRHRH